MPTKFTLLFILQIQLMEDGLNGLSGLHAVLPVVEELVKEQESVATHHHNLMGGTVLVSAFTI